MLEVRQCLRVRTARDGCVCCIARPVHRGRTTQVWDATITHVDSGRTLVLSATYGQSSAFDERARELDPTNRWLARGPAVRLPAESLRDQSAVLEVNVERDGRSILLFARERADDRAFWFLGPATYRGHVGEKPMAITWELDVPLPGDLYAAFAAAVA